MLQLEYTPMAQYRGEFRRIAQALFEHDVYFQSIGRGLGHMTGLVARCKARIEYLRALRYELRVLPRVRPGAGLHARESRLPAVVPAGRSRRELRAGLRAGIDTSRYEFRPCGREPLTHAVPRQLPPRSRTAWRWTGSCDT